MPQPTHTNCSYNNSSAPYSRLRLSNNNQCPQGSSSLHLPLSRSAESPIQHLGESSHILNRNQAGRRERTAIIPVDFPPNGRENSPFSRDRINENKNRRDTNNSLLTPAENRGFGHSQSGSIQRDSRRFKLGNRVDQQ